LYYQNLEKEASLEEGVPLRYGKAIDSLSNLIDGLGASFLI